MCKVWRIEGVVVTGCGPRRHGSGIVRGAAFIRAAVRGSKERCKAGELNQAKQWQESQDLILQ